MKKITFAALAVPLMWVLLLLLLLGNNKLYAQEQQILNGVVKDANGIPLEGVTVWQKETNNGTQTKEQGFYSLQMVPQTAVTFEYLGYKTQTLTATGKILNVTLITDDDVLDEIVINAGYYSVKDKERTGSISKITSKEISQQPVANPLAAMQGRMAGVNITQSSGTPGGGFDIQIRGRNSLRTEGNAPLYIVDGVPYPSQSMSDSNIAGAILPLSIGSALNSINPNDIESIEVLKDADATAIYGSRGANGVVLITTKKGSSDKTTFSFQSTTSVGSIAKYMDLMSTEEYLKMRRTAFANDGITTYPANAYDVNGTWDENRYTDWQKEFIGGKAVSQNTQFSIAGGSGKTNYLFSASHRQDGTVFPGDFGYKRTNFLLNINHTSKDNKFHLSATVQKGNQKNKLLVYDFTKYGYMVPNAPALFAEKNILNWENNTFENPLAKRNEKYLADNNDFTARTTISYEIFKNLELKLSTGIVDKNNGESRITPSTVYNPNLELDSSISSLTKTLSSLSSWIIEPTISWSGAKAKSRWDAILGATFEEKNQSVFGIQANNFTSDALIYNASNAATQKIIKDSEILYRYAAIFGRLNFAYNDLYIVNLTGRRDGSSRFGPNNRFANFGAIGAAWLFSREKLFEDMKWLSFGKIRSSYGITGSDLIGDYQYMNTYGISVNKYDGIVGLDPLRLYNPDFSWETNKKLELGLELEFFNGRIAPSVSWYRNRSSNQLVGVPLPGTTGFNSVQANLAATVENSGWELTLRTLNVNNDHFKWSTSLNLTIPKNKLLSFPNLEESTYAEMYEVGKSIYVRKLYRFLGVNNETGLYEVDDLNKDGVIDIKDRVSTAEIGVIFFGGFSNHISYKGWSLDILWQFVKQQGYVANFYNPLLGTSNNQPAFMNDFWSEENTTGKYQKPSSGGNSQAAQAFERYRSSDAIITNTSYIKLKNIQIMYGFKLPKKQLDFSVFIQGTNLLTLTKFEGLDPETMSSFLPPLRVFSCGFNVKF